MSKKSFLVTLIGYALFLGILINFYFLGRLSEYLNYFLYTFLLLIIKDVFVYFYKFKALEVTNLDFDLLEQDKVSDRIFFLILNRKYIFPFLLIVYIVLLLINQIKLFGLTFDENISNIILGLVVASGVLTIFKEEIDQKYEVKKTSTPYTVFMLLSIFFLSFFGTYIILKQTENLGNLSYVISLISGVLIYLIGIMILQEDEEENIE